MHTSQGGKISSELPPNLETLSPSEKLPPESQELPPPASNLAYNPSGRFSEKTRSIGGEKSTSTFESVAKSRQIRLPEIKGIPWRGICHLAIQYQDGQSSVGSGFLVGPRTIITAGHCVYLPGSGQATGVRVVPARQDANAPFGWVDATLVDYSHEWLNTNPAAPEPEHDYGAIFLPSSSTLHQRLGYIFKWAVFTDPDIKRIQTANVAGFPNHGDGAVLMETDSGPLVIDDEHPINDLLLYHRLETHEGQSGGPIMLFDPATSALTVFGIHTYGHEVANVARRINRNLGNAITRWIATPQPFMAGARLS